MRARHFGLTVASLLVLWLMAVPAPATAAFVLRVEGEDRDTNAPFCAFDQEKMQTAAWAGASGDAALFYPEDKCWAAWTVFLVQATSKLFLGSISSSDPSHCMQWLVLIDGVLFGNTFQDCGPSDIVHLEVHRVASSLVKLPAGLHEVTVVAHYTSGPRWANSYVDYLQFES